ncbi:MAG: hypothetical protein IJK04_12085 [Kiritimatiellae bacterium]|nr:hypothetical protein [Kiritimatiellia bacterium]
MRRDVRLPKAAEAVLQSVRKHPLRKRPRLVGEAFDRGEAFHCLADGRVAEEGGGTSQLLGEEALDVPRGALAPRIDRLVVEVRLRKEVPLHARPLREDSIRLFREVVQHLRRRRGVREFAVLGLRVGHAAEGDRAVKALHVAEQDIRTRPVRVRRRRLAHLAGERDKPLREARLDGKEVLRM